MGRWGQLKQVAPPDAGLVLLFHPSPRVGVALLRSPGLHPWPDPVVYGNGPCTKGWREEVSALPLLFPLGFWERSSSLALEAEQLWQGGDGACQTTFPFVLGQEGGGGTMKSDPPDTCLLWAVFPQATTRTATI